MDISKKKMRVSLAALILVATLLGVSYTFGENWFRTFVFDLLKASTAFWVFVFWPIIVPLIAALFLYVADHEKRDARRYYRDVNTEEKKDTRALGLIASVLLVFGLANLFVPAVGLTGSQAWRTGHDSKFVLAANVSTSKDPHPAYDPRVNLVQAEKIVKLLQNDPAISSNTPAQYTRVDDTPAWCVGGNGQKDRLQRVYTTTVACITEDGKVVRVSFEGPVPSASGAFSTNLHKVVSEINPGHSVAEEDIRFYIEGNSPKMIASATSRNWGIDSIRVPAGVYVWDKNGNVSFDETVSKDEYKVAVLPYEVARNLRESLNSRAGYYCAGNPNKPKCLKKNTPYESTVSVNGSTVSDVNGQNATEFVLHREDKRISMVSPLTYFGSGRNVTAYFDVPADELKAGVTPAAVLYEGVNEVPHTLIVQTLTPAYTSDLTWATEIDANVDNSTASRIFEITPTMPGKVRLTIGTATNPQYVVEVNSTLLDDSGNFSWCIYADNGAKKIECREATDGEAPIGTLRGINIANNSDDSNDTGSGDPISVPTDLSKLSNEELLRLIEQAAGELAKR